MALDIGRVSSTPDENALPTPIDIHISITGHGVDDDFNPVPVDTTFDANTAAIVYTLNGDTHRVCFALLGGISGSILYNLIEQLHKAAPDALREALTRYLLMQTLKCKPDDETNDEEEE